jgi:hypothetical protein
MTGNGGFAIQTQEADKWCWAAVSASVNHYFFPDSTLSQCQIARRVLGVDSCCGNRETCNQVAKLDVALEKSGTIVREPLARSLSFEEIKQEIDGRRPICARIQWAGGGGHFVVIRGYRELASGAEQVDIADPWFVDGTFFYKEFLSGYLNIGQWTDTFLVGT